MSDLETSLPVWIPPQGGYLNIRASPAWPPFSRNLQGRKGKENPDDPQTSASLCSPVAAGAGIV
jgi:hypothetical protein